MLASESPLPPHSGYRLRILHLARQLSRSAEVELAILGPAHPAGGEPFAVRSLTHQRSRAVAGSRAWRTPYAVEKHRSSTMRRLAAGPRWSTVHVESLALMPAARDARVPVVLDAHNVESDLLASTATQLPFGAPRARLSWEASKTLRFEQTAVAGAAATCATSQYDAAVFEGWGAREVVVVPNGVDTAAVAFHSRQPGAQLTYIGHLGYQPNAAAVSELVHEILPRVRRSVPSVTIRLIGREGPELDPRATAGVEVVGEVPDVEPELRRARAVVLPLRSGSGTRLKVLEALAAGVPIVATPFAVRGIDVRDGTDVLLGSTSRELAEQVVRVCTDDALAHRLGVNGRALAERRYEWSIVAEPLRALHERLAGRPA